MALTTEPTDTLAWDIETTTADITITTEPWWRAQPQQGGGASLSYEMLREAMQSLYAAMNRPQRQQYVSNWSYAQGSPWVTDAAWVGDILQDGFARRLHPDLLVEEGL
jgi:hypothetical protein